MDICGWWHWVSHIIIATRPRSISNLRSHGNDGCEVWILGTPLFYNRRATWQRRSVAIYGLWSVPAVVKGVALLALICRGSLRPWLDSELINRLEKVLRGQIRKGQASRRARRCKKDQEGKVHKRMEKDLKRMEKEELMTFSEVHLQVLASVTSHVAAACA